jgi:indole-3-glycerol phosphate synthase
MLTQILDASRRRAASLAPRVGELRQLAGGLPPARPFAAALAAPGLQVIAEIKRRSPSAGAIRTSVVPAEQAATYERGGAAALSVLTEPDAFGGSLVDLAAARSATTLPVLRKDFTVHPVQVWEARAAGADAVLLIVAALGDDELEVLLGEARRAGLDALVEAHDALEVERARRAGAALIGVNNRDLMTFRTDLATAEALAPALEGVPVRVAESGVSSPDAAARMAAAGYDAILVGEAVMRSDDPADFITRLRDAAR